MNISFNFHASHLYVGMFAYYPHIYTYLHLGKHDILTIWAFWNFQCYVHEKVICTWIHV